MPVDHDRLKLAGVDVDSTVIDLTDLVNVIDDDMQGAPIVIAATAEPADPQYEYTLEASDFPSNPNDYATGFGVVLAVGGKNLQAGSPTALFIQGTLNGELVNEVTGERSTTIDADKYWNAGVTCSLTRALLPGDKIGIKVWSTTGANKLDIRAATIYVVPIFQDANSFYVATAAWASNQDWLSLEGAIAGVTYYSWSDDPSLQLASTTMGDDGLLGIPGIHSGMVIDTLQSWLNSPSVPGQLMTVGMYSDSAQIPEGGFAGTANLRLSIVLVMGKNIRQVKIH